MALKGIKDPKYNKCRVLLFKALTRSNDVKPATTADIEQFLNDECASDVRWKYVMFSLNTMLAMNQLLTVDLERYNLLMQDMRNARPAETSAPPMSPDTFSIDQKKAFMTSLQFIVCLAILPALHPGVGIPLVKRTIFSGLLQV